MGETKDLTNNDLRSVATYQKAILMCIVADAAVYVAAISLSSDLRLLLLVPHFGIIIAAIVFVFLLSTKVYNPVVGVFLGLLAMIPGLGLLALLIINKKATAILQRQGIRVGLLGANMSDFKAGPRPRANREDEDEKYRHERR